MYRYVHPFIALAALALFARPALAQGPWRADEINAAVETLAAGADQALPTSDLEALQAALRSPSADRRAAAQQSLVTKLTEYASAQRGQRTLPSAIDQNWAITPDPFNATAELARARASNQLAIWLSGLAPPQAGYIRLAEAYKRYRAIQSAGGWLPLGDTGLRLGDSGPAVAALRDRLRIEGFVEPDQADAFDLGLEAALKKFQTANGLAGDGILGPLTIAALNVPVDQKLATIAANLERWRWLPRTMPARRIEVNIAAQTLTLYDADRDLVDMRVVVGTRAHMTPMFIAPIEGVILNPSWTVPAWIASSEIMPLAAREPAYLEQHGFSRLGGNLVQAPGPANALGQLKFDMPNRFGVYLHDTPARSLFARADRRLSHGCVRLEAPRELAAQVLALQGWTREALDAAIAGGVTQRIDLDAHLPVFLLYQTAFVDNDGDLHFGPDIYGWDAKLNMSLETKVALAPSLSATCEIENPW